MCGSERNLSTNKLNQDRLLSNIKEKNKNPFWASTTLIINTHTDTHTCLILLHLQPVKQNYSLWIQKDRKVKKVENT